MLLDFVSSHEGGAVLLLVGQMIAVGNKSDLVDCMTTLLPQTLALPIELKMFCTLYSIQHW